MRVVERPAAQRVAHPHHLAPQPVVPGVGDPRRGGEHRRAARREDVDPLVRAPPAVAVHAEDALHRPAVLPLDREGERRLERERQRPPHAAQQLGLQPHEVVAVALRLDAHAQRPAVGARHPPRRRERVVRRRRLEQVDEEPRRQGALRLDGGDEPLPAPRPHPVRHRPRLALGEVAGLAEGERHRHRGRQRAVGRPQPVAPERRAVEPRVAQRARVALVRALLAHHVAERVVGAAGEEGGEEEEGEAAHDGAVVPRERVGEPYQLSPGQLPFLAPSTPSDSSDTGTRH